MNGQGLIDEALFRITGDTKTKPNVLFVGSDNEEYLLFYSLDAEPEDIESYQRRVNDLGVEYVGKFECFGIPTDVLWDVRNK